jgi:predicted Fe-Mo cluster-binding NifX family protein
MLNTGWMRSTNGPALLFIAPAVHLARSASRRVSRRGLLFHQPQHHSNHFMKIGLPITETGEFSPHFGGSAKIAVFDVDPASRSVTGHSVLAPASGGPCSWSEDLRAAGIEVLLVGGMGAGAQQKMAAVGIEVQAGVPEMAPEAIIEALLKGLLTRGDSCCGGGHDHDHDHHHGQGHHHGGCGCSH